VERPRLSLGVERVAPNQTVTFVGANMTAGCNDAPTGCTGHSTDPLHDIRVAIAPAGGAWNAVGPETEIAMVNADDSFAFRIEDVVMPSSPGRYIVVAAGLPGRQPYRLGIEVVAPRT
jgi:hypothetical protein